MCYLLEEGESNDSYSPEMKSIVSRSFKIRQQQQQQQKVVKRESGWRAKKKVYEETVSEIKLYEIQARTETASHFWNYKLYMAAALLHESIFESVYGVCMHTIYCIHLMLISSTKSRHPT